MTRVLTSQIVKGFSILAIAFSANMAVAETPDDCTEKLEKYLDTLRKNVASDYISPRQKEASQKLIDKAARLRANTEYTYTDCAVFDKLLF